MSEIIWVSLIRKQLWIKRFRHLRVTKVRSNSNAYQNRKLNYSNSCLIRSDNEVSGYVDNLLFLSVKWNPFIISCFRINLVEIFSLFHALLIIVSRFWWKLKFLWNCQQSNLMSQEMSWSIDWKICFDWWEIGGWKTGIFGMRTYFLIVFVVFWILLQISQKRLKRFERFFF